MGPVSPKGTGRDCELAGPKRNHWRTSDNEIGAAPRLLLCKEPQLVFHPLVPKRDRLILATVAALLDVSGDAASLGLGKV